MKKYAKPELFYESFTTADCIAACTLKALSTQELNCAGMLLDAEGNSLYSVFGATQTDCSTHPQGAGDICYNSVNANYTVFGS